MLVILFLLYFICFLSRRMGLSSAPWGLWCFVVTILLVLLVIAGTVVLFFRPTRPINWITLEASMPEPSPKIKPTVAELWVPVLLGLLLPALFILICLLLMQWPEVVPVSANKDNDASVLKTFISQTLTSKPAVVVYGVLLAGVLGSFMRHLLLQFRSDMAGTPLTASLTDLGAYLLLGASAAFVVGVLLPSALVREPPVTLLEETLNLWGLLILAGVVGYGSRGMLGQLAVVLSRLLAQVGQPFGDEIREDITKSVRTGVQDALSPPKMINYEGFFNVDIVASNAETTSVISDEGVARLSSGKSYELQVLFTTAAPPSNTNARVQALRIQGGIDESSVPFRLSVDFGSVRIPIAERRISVPKTGSSNVESFKFTPSPSSPSNEGLISGDANAEEVTASSGGWPPIALGIYQHGVFCAICLIPQEIKTFEGMRAQGAAR